MKTTKVRRSSLAAVLLSLILAVAVRQGWLQPLTETAEQSQPGLYKVLEVSDGDTIQVDMNGNKETIRFIGVDTPETQDPRKPVQCFGQAATDFTKRLIGDSPVRLEAEPLSTNRDRYDRLLRYVYLPDGRLVQAEIIKGGYGFAYTSFPFNKTSDFLDYQRQAREQNKGLWSQCQPSENKFGGYTSNPAN